MIASGGLLGGCALAAGGHWLYVDLILLWSAPPLALHWFYGGDVQWRARHVLAASLILATFYLWSADRAAIGARIWTVSPLHSTGWNPLGLPVEEAVFFLVTNLLVIQGLLLFFQWTAPPPPAQKPGNALAWRRVGRRADPGIDYTDAAARMVARALGTQLGLFGLPH